MSEPAASTADVTDSDSGSIKSDSFNETSREFKILFEVRDIPYWIGELDVLSTNVKDKLVKNSLVFRVLNTYSSALGVWLPSWTKEKEWFVHWVCLYCVFHLVLPTIQPEIYDPSNDGNDKDTWNLFQVPTIAYSFDTTALEDVMKLYRNLANWHHSSLTFEPWFFQLQECNTEACPLWGPSCQQVNQCIL